MAFCEQDGNVLVDEKNWQLHLNKILYWYMSDFVKSKDEFPSFIVQYLRGEKKQRLVNLVQNGGISVVFFDYDWSSNDDNFITFKKGNLSNESIFPYCTSQI
eukprot:772811_1